MWVTCQRCLSLSVVEALRHAGDRYGWRPYLRWINAEDLETEGAERYLEEVNGLLVPEVSATGCGWQDLGSSICPRAQDGFGLCQEMFCN